jgi:hypothetical protein
MFKELYLYLKLLKFSESLNVSDTVPSTGYANIRNTKTEYLLCQQMAKAPKRDIKM